MSVFPGDHNIISPLGFSSAQNYKALVDGKMALSQQTFSFSGDPFFCSKIDEGKLDSEFKTSANPSKYTKLEKMCILSIKDVLRSSGVDLGDKKNLLILSTTKGNIDLLESPSNTIPAHRQYLPEFAKVVGEFFSCSNIPQVVSNACISGLLAMIIAKRYISAGQYENIIVCGADLVSEFTLSGFRSFSALSDEACRPFDKNRKGINLGEAAASILLSAKALSNVIISSGASANDANHISGPSRDGSGLYQAIRHSLHDSHLKEPDFISAHGTATEFNDDMESIAFERAELKTIPVHSLKGYYGHTLGAAGVLESIIAIECLRNNILLASMGFREQGTARELNVISTTSGANLKTCLKTASGFGGCNAAAVFEKI